jgi:anti-anti-sigma regulatory factor
VLKITVTETPGERRWVVQGRLVGPWVSELRATWRRWGSRDKRTCIIDLNDVTFIDKSGERLLRAMSKKGAQLITSGVYIKHLLEQLKNSRITPAERMGRNSSADRLARTEEQ